jgi:hypothetical protein
MIRAAALIAQRSKQRSKILLGSAEKPALFRFLRNVQFSGGPDLLMRSTPHNPLSYGAQGA